MSKKVETAKICVCKDWMRSACFGDISYEVEGKTYCIMHYPNQEKRVAFEKVLEQKKTEKDFNFLGVWFPSEVEFNDYTFETHARFASAIFTERVYFRRANFLTADFSRVEFQKEALFDKSNFYISANFSFSTFN